MKREGAASRCKMKIGKRIGWIALLALMAGVVTWHLVYRENSQTVKEVDPSRAISNKQKLGSEAETLSFAALAPSFNSEAISNQAVEEQYARRLEERGATLEEARQWNSDGNLGKSISILSTPSFEYPLRIERRLSKDPLTGEEHVVETKTMAANRMLVRFKSDMRADTVDALSATANAKVLGRLSSDPIYEIEFETSNIETLPRGRKRLLAESALGTIEYLEPNYIVYASVDPNDPSYADQSLWGLFNTGQNSGSDDVDIDAPEGWDLRTDASSVIVGVIDTGVRYDHEDLAANMWVNASEIAGNGLDDDGNGYIDDIHGINAITGSGDPSDDNGHGTHIAGTVGAVGDNGVGVVGVAWNARLMALKFLNESGGGSIADAIRCIEYATSMGASVLNNSWGGDSYSQALMDAIENAADVDVIVVAAAGNSARDTDMLSHYPSGFDVRNMVSVGSINRNGNLSVFSNYGQESVDLVAPGADILSTWGDEIDAYQTISGTSMATPHVTGILALQIAEYPSDSIYEQINRLLYSVDTRMQLEGVVRTSGWANLRSGLELIDAPFPPVYVERPPGRIAEKEGGTLFVETLVESDLPVTYQWYFEGAELVGQTQRSLEITSLALEQAGRYQLESRNDDGLASIFVDVEVLALDGSLAQAVDGAFYDIFSQGDSDWEIYQFDSIVGETSIRSGDIGEGEFSSVFADVSGPGEVRFHWRLSAEDFYDVGEFTVDGESREVIIESGDWAEVSVALEEARSYRLGWTYTKDFSVDSGQDSLFVDGLAIYQSGESPPIIVREPVSTVVSPNTQIELAVEAIGEGLSYQWYFNGTQAIGTNFATLVIANAGVSNDGEYHVVVSNAYGNATSVAAIVEVAAVPVEIAVDPADVTAPSGQRVSFDLEVTGSTPISYQWFRDNVALVGEISSSLTLESVTEADEGFYRVEAWNAFSATNQQSRPAELRVEDVIVGPVFVKQPVDTFIQEGDLIRLYSAAEGTLPMTYQWFKDDLPIPGQINRILEINSATAQDSGEYAIVASNAQGMERSRSADVFVMTAVNDSLDLPGADWTVSGDSFFFSQSDVTHDGVDALESAVAPESGFVKAELSTVIDGPTNLSLYVKQETYLSVQSLVLYMDDVVVGSVVGNRDWNRVFVPVGQGSHQLRLEYEYTLGSTIWIDEVSLEPSPLVLTNPKSAVHELGEMLDLSVHANGDGTLLYQWYKDGDPILGANEASFSIGAVSSEDAGSYTVRVSSAFGEIESDSAIVEIVDEVKLEYGDGSLDLEFGLLNKWEPARDGNKGIALRSAAIAPGEKSMIETSIEGPINIVFNWRVEGIDCCPILRFLVNGAPILSSYNGYENFSFDEMQELAFRLEEGTHNLRWEFETSNTAAEGTQFAYLDNVRATSLPQVSFQPEHKLLVERATASLFAGIVGNEPFTYRWYKDGVLLAGEDSRQLQLADVTSDDAGEYHAIATDASGSQVTTRAALVEVVEGVFEALDMDFGTFRMTGDARWAPQTSESWDLEDALELFLDHPDTDSNLSLALFFEDGERKSVGFYMKVEGMVKGDRVEIAENFNASTLIFENQAWTRFVIPMRRTGTNYLNWKIARGVVSASNPIRVVIDSVELIDDPVFYQQPQSVGVSVGTNASFNAEAVGAQELAYSFGPLGEEAAALGANAIVDFANVALEDSGQYRFVAENELADTDSRPVVLTILKSSFGESVGLPGSGLSTRGDVLWKVDENVRRLGKASLGVSGLGPNGDSVLRWRVSGPGTLQFNWRLSTTTPSERLRLLINGSVVDFASRSGNWEEIEIVFGEGDYQVEWLFTNYDQPVSKSGFAWVDSVRFFTQGARSYEDWRVAMGLIGDSDWNEDIDSDGVLNYVEYALSLDPSMPSEMPVPVVEVGEFALTASVSFRPVSGADDVLYGLEISPDLENWYPVKGDWQVSETDPNVVIGQYLAENPFDTSLYVRLGVYYLRGSE